MATSLLGPGTGQTSESPWSRPTRECQGCAATTGALMVELEKGRETQSGSTVIVIGGTSGIGLETARQASAAGAKVVVTGTAGLSAITANAALELAPLRVNAVAAGFVDTPLSARPTSRR